MGSITMTRFLYLAFYLLIHTSNFIKKNVFYVKFSKDDE
jgi:hypothetical protein